MKQLWKSTWRYRRDLINVAKYGLRAPKLCQLMYCRPTDITVHSTYVDQILPDYCATIPGRYAQHSGVQKKLMLNFVAKGDWDRHIMPLVDVLPYRLTTEKLASDQSWEDVGEFKRMEDLIRIKGGSDGCRNRQDVERRYARMDQMITKIQNQRRLMTQKELGDARFRELGGIHVAIGRNGEVIKLQGGTHRLAIAVHFDLPIVPVCIRLVHEDSIRNGSFRALMDRSSKLARNTKRQQGPDTEVMS